MEVRAGREGGERDPIVRATSYEYSSSTVSLLLASSSSSLEVFPTSLQGARARPSLILSARAEG